MDIQTSFGRGPSISQGVKDVITSTYRDALKEDPGITAKEIMKKVHDELSSHGKQLRLGWPGLSAIQKEIQEINKKANLLPQDTEDNPWSVADIAQDTIPPQDTFPPEALPTVLSAWATTQVENCPLTIREARWVARLYYVFREAGLTGLDHIQLLIETAKQYASHEVAFKLAGEHPDKSQDMWWRWFNDAKLFMIMTGGTGPLKELLELQKTKEEKK